MCISWTIKWLILLMRSATMMIILTELGSNPVLRGQRPANDGQDPWDGLYAERNFTLNFVLRSKQIPLRLEKFSV